MNDKDIIAVREFYPHIVTRISTQSLNLELAEWVMRNVGDKMIIIHKEQVYVENRIFPATRITYGFVNADDATAFKIKYP